MSDSKPFTLAVVKGASRGEILRTDKRRISVGSGKDNDLSIDDPDISPRHFLVLIDHGRWRIHTFSPEKSITVDRRWSHPTNGNRGALITAAGSEILLYPGALEKEIIEREIMERADSMPLPVVTAQDRDLITRISSDEMEFESDERAEKTIPIDTSTMPTLTGERLSEELRMAARAKLSDERAAPTPPGIPWEADTAGFEWQNGQVKVRKFPELVREKSLPEVVPEPDDRPAGSKNAWGDREDRKSRPPASEVAKTIEDAPPPQLVRKNAWGDRPNRAIETPTSDRSNRVLETQSNGRDSTPQLRPHLGPSQIAHLLAIEDLAQINDPALSIIRDPDGEMATSIRLLGTRVEEFMRTYGYRVYMVTSPEPVTGKTTTAANLALALAEDTHRRIALIEASFRQPRFAEIFGIPEDYGLIPLLEGRVQLSDAIAKLADRNLVILPSGGKYSNPAELLSSPRFKALIAELANTVDLAIIDAPAVTPYADANILLPLVDAAFLVVSERKTHATWIEKAQKQLGEARILGAVYNRVPKRARS